MMAHPLALQLRNLQTLVEIARRQELDLVFPAPLMSTIQELGAFLAREANAAAALAGPDCLASPHLPLIWRRDPQREKLVAG